MLTEEQLKRLQPLTTHPKYGPIVKAAIIGWKKCRPLNGAFGITLENFKFRRSKHFKGCCFLGKALGI